MADAPPVPALPAAEGAVVATMTIGPPRGGAPAVAGCARPAFLRYMARHDGRSSATRYARSVSAREAKSPLAGARGRGGRTRVVMAWGAREAPSLGAVAAVDGRRFVGGASAAAAS